MKYIVKNNNDVILFSDTIRHDAMAREEDVHTSGFFSINQTGEGQDIVYCYGESITLNKVSDPVRDEKLLTLALFGFERASKIKHLDV